MDLLSALDAVQSVDNDEFSDGSDAQSPTVAASHVAPPSLMDALHAIDGIAGFCHESQVDDLESLSDGRSPPAELTCETDLQLALIASPACEKPAGPQAVELAGGITIPAQKAKAVDDWILTVAHASRSVPNHKLEQDHYSAATYQCCEKTHAVNTCADSTYLGMDRKRYRHCRSMVAGISYFLERRQWRAFMSTLGCGVLTG